MRTPRRREALYTYVTWKTYQQTPWLKEDQLQQAAYHAIRARSNELRCRTQIISDTGAEIHVVFKFSASVPLSTLVTAVMEASSLAVSHAMTILMGRSVSPAEIWEASYKVDTITPEELESLIDQVGALSQDSGQGSLWPSGEIREGSARYSNTSVEPKPPRKMPTRCQYTKIA